MSVLVPGITVVSNNPLFKDLGVGYVQEIRGSRAKVEFRLTLFSTPPYLTESKIIDVDQLEVVKSPLDRMRAGELDDAWKFDLRQRAAHLLICNRDGQLSNARTDLLPHQITIAHRIVSSPRRRFLLAEEVGLGKTIETGIVIYALGQRGEAGRILIITPAGLTLQWQEEMKEKFDFNFAVYKEDVMGPLAFDHNDRIIASIDTLKLDQPLKKGQMPGHKTIVVGSRDWDLMFVETHASDYASHFFLSQADEISGASPETIKRCRDGLARTFASIDSMIGRLMSLKDEGTVFMVVSDHGGTPNHHRAVNIDTVLEETGFLVYRDGAKEVDWSRTLAANVGLVHIFINLEDREPGGIVAPEDYRSTQLDIIAALNSYIDAETGLCPFALALTRQDAEMVNLWGDLVGDVVYALRPEFDGAHGKQLPTAELGIGGQHCTFVVAGAGVRAAGALRRQVRAVDVAPTLCYLLGVPMPRDVEGGVVYEALEDPDWHLRT